jgi:predicted N-acetyltransferase YhbS
MAIVVRMANTEDADAVRRVGEEAFAEVRSIYRPNPAAVANLAALTPALERLVAEDMGQVIGTVRFGVFGDLLRVIGLAVLPQWRRRGAARNLLETLAIIARQRNCRALALYTVTKTGNVPIFERLGFSLISERPDEYSVSVTGEPLLEAYMERSVA